jgi:glutamate-1-semialdehyde 2,1-aminomutase
MEQVKFAKDGSTVTTAAVKLARAVTNRDIVAVCGDHPFFSYNDWFFAVTPMTAGIPASERRLTVTFRFNDLDSVRRLFDEHPSSIAAVVLEPARTDDPHPDFLPGLKALCEKNGTILVFDEMITGFRWHRRGAQHVYGVKPHLSTFGKALANGFSLSALAGERQIMELGGLTHAKERVFLLSTTHGAEVHALAAAIATMREYTDQPVIETLYERGKQLREGVEQVIRRRGLARAVRLFGRDCNLAYHTGDDQGVASQALRTLFLQELIRGGVLAPSFVVSFSHSREDIERTIEVVDESLRIYADHPNARAVNELVAEPRRRIVAAGAGG